MENPHMYTEACECVCTCMCVLPRWWWWWAVGGTQSAPPALSEWCLWWVGGDTESSLHWERPVSGSHDTAWGNGTSAPTTLGIQTRHPAISLLGKKKKKTHTRRLLLTISYCIHRDKPKQMDKSTCSFIPCIQNNKQQSDWNSLRAHIT